jgi:hypothetical protein
MRLRRISPNSSYALMNSTPLQQAVLDYVVTVDGLYGHYLDSTDGFVANAKSVEQVQSQLITVVPPGTDLDARNMFYGHGNPNDQVNRILHRTTQGEYKQRNAKGGHNHVRAAQLLVVLIYEYWDSEHRAKIATAMNLPSPNDLQVPLIGDLRLLRQDVIHHRSLLQLKHVEKLQVLPGFNAGDELTLDGEAVESIVHGLKAAMDELVVDSGETDPEHRKIWRVQ